MTDIRNMERERERGRERMMRRMVAQVFLYLKCTWHFGMTSYTTHK